MIMQKLTTRFAISVIIVLLLAGCATVKDVQRSTDLIRTDNELTRLLVDVRPSDQEGAATSLEGLAIYAKDEADALKGDRGTFPDAIAYYRIAATAYWRSGKPEVVNDLFEVTDSGTKLCVELGENAPDRDCLFLQLVIPFAGLESKAKNPDLSGLLERVNFNNSEGTPGEIKIMGEIRDSLIQVKPLVQRILVFGKDDRLLSHRNMREYYCDNAKEAFDYYDDTAAVFVTKVREYHANFKDNTPSLGITLDEAREIRKLEKGVPSFCQ
jgi:hypothetical protein